MSWRNDFLKEAKEVNEDEDQNSQNPLSLSQSLIEETASHAQLYNLEQMPFNESQKMESDDLISKYIRTINMIAQIQRSCHNVDFRLFPITNSVMYCSDFLAAYILFHASNQTWSAFFAISSHLLLVSSIDSLRERWADWIESLISWFW